jgi:hypothetical protein
MKDERALKKALKGYKDGGRQVGRPRERWTDKQTRLKMIITVR